MRPGGLILAALLIATLAGCPPRGKPFGPDALERPEEVLDAVRRARRAPAAAEGEARVRLDSPTGKFGADHFVVVQSPASMRLETLSFFGNPLALLVVHEGHLTLWDIDRALAYEGPATAQTLGMMVPVGLGPEAVVAVLLGAPPLLADADLRLDLDHTTRTYRLTLTAGEARQELDVDPQSFAVLRVRWLEGDQAVGELEYSRHQVEEGGHFPHEMRYREAGGAEVELRWREVRLDPELDEALFRVPLPPDVRTVIISGEAPPEVESVLPPEAPQSPDDGVSPEPAEAPPEPPESAGPAP